MSDFVEKESYMKKAKLNEEQQEPKPKPEIDYLTKMPDSVITNILAKLTTKEAVQTCILAKGWEHLWKNLPNLMATSTHFEKHELFIWFVSDFLDKRNPKIKLTNVDFHHDEYVYVPVSLVKRIINEAMTHDVESLKIKCHIYQDIFLFNGTKFPCSTLKHLDLSFESRFKAVLPKRLEFPELIECHLRNIEIQRLEEGEEKIGEPFSKCKKMTTLWIENCTLNDDTEYLLVVGENLSNLLVVHHTNGPFFNIQMRTPNLVSFSYEGPIDDDTDHMLFQHDVNSLQRVTLGPLFPINNIEFSLPTLCGWLRKYTNVQYLKTTFTTLEILSEIPDNFEDTERLNLGNIKKLTIYNLPIDPFGPIQSRQAQKPLTYLLRDSPMAEVIVASEGNNHWINIEKMHYYLRKANRQP